MDQVVQHSSKTDAWGTPPWLLDMVREVLGPIDFDPCSSSEFNKNVQAKRFYSHGGEFEPWPEVESIFINPPGERRPRGQSLPGLFWQRLMKQYHEAKFGHAIWLGFSLEHLRTTQEYAFDGDSLLDFPFCIPKKRIRFVDENGNPGKSPTHANVIGYIPSNIDETCKFHEVFSRLGKVRV